MNSGLFYALVGSLVLTFILAFSVPLMGKKRQQEEYSFLSYFPYELFETSRAPHFLTGRIFEGLYLCAFLLSTSVLFLPGYEDISFSILIVIFYVATALGTLSLTLVSLSFPKQHLALFFLTGASMALKDAASGYYLVAIYRYNLEGYVLALAIVLFVFALIYALLFLNPRLKDWAKMKAVANPDGTASYVRPRPFVLAFSEWLFIGLDFLATLVILFAFYFIALEA
jgi:hypothetical protein